jgi:hypothetical protein
MGGIRNMYKSLIQKTNMKVTLGRQKAQTEKKHLNGSLGKWMEECVQFAVVNGMTYSQVQ